MYNRRKQSKRRELFKRFESAWGYFYLLKKLSFVQTL